MAFSRMKEFSYKEQHLAVICQALCHPARIRLIGRIINSDGQAIDFENLTKDIPLGDSTISQHLKYLRTKKLIMFGIKNGQSYYMLNDNMPNLVKSVTKVMSIMKKTSVLEVKSEVINIAGK